MAYYLARPRELKVFAGDKAKFAFPGNIMLTADLGPLDLFGPSDSTSPRSLIVKGAAGVRVLWNALLGRAEVQSDVFLPAAEFHAILDDLEIILEGNRLTGKFVATSEEAVFVVLEFLEYSVPAFLSLTSGVYVDVERISGTINESVDFNAEFTDFRHGFQITDVEDRLQKISEAIQLADRADARTMRVLLASLYFRQALRLASPFVSDAPELNLAEVVINLAKALDLLFGDHDGVRNGCRKLGFSEAEIKSQIVPLLLIRNKLDVAHCVGTPLPDSLLLVLKSYCSRASDNVKAILLRAARNVVQGGDAVAPLEENAKHVEDRSQLPIALKSYLNDPGLLP